MAEPNGDKETEIDVDSDGKKEKEGKKELKYGDIRNAFSSPHNNNIADLLVVPGDDPLGIAMRTVLKNHSEGTILATAYARDYAEMKEFEDVIGQEELLFQMALNPSIDGLSREQLVRAIIGDREFKNKRSFTDKVKDMAFGNKEEKAV